ncbi:MAG: multiheme c-type cytochrome [Rubripirellula sp.]|nr:multiheme c-type cytochrome [Rubripirellula sp.]
MRVDYFLFWSWKLNLAIRAPQLLAVFVTVTLLGLVAFAATRPEDATQVGSVDESGFGNSQNSDPGSSKSGSSKSGEPAYVGRQVCAECHRENFEQHAKHGHAMTFHHVPETDLANRLAGQIVDGGEGFGSYHYRQGDDGELFAQLPELSELSELPIEYALGSGHNAQTFLTLRESANADSLGLEHRVSLYPGDRLAITVGHENKTANSLLESYGSTVHGETVDRCVYCHTTTAQITGNRIDNLVANVNCEKCHGPGSEHVALARQSATPPPYSVGKADWDVESELQLCGDCHRLPQGLSKSELREYPDNAVRFQPVGLLRSACYLKSGRQLRCSTCHNPHVSTHGVSKADHIANCVSCHDESIEKHTICPVNATSGCIECHMPAIDQKQGIKFHDHWIRVREND